MNDFMNHWGEDEEDYGPAVYQKSYNEKQFLMEKAYHEARGWTNIKDWNGDTIGWPSQELCKKCPWLNPFKEKMLSIPKGQLEFPF